MAEAHAEMCNDAVSLSLRFWKLKERDKRETLTTPEHRGRRIGDEHCIPNSISDISHDAEDFRARLASLGWCAEMSESGSSSCTDEQGTL